MEVYLYLPFGSQFCDSSFNTYYILAQFECMQEHSRLRFS